MKKFLTILVFNIFLLTKTIAATANCSNGKCEFINSNHYKKASTYCAQTLNYEEVETNFLNFTIIETGESCVILVSE